MILAGSASLGLVCAGPAAAWDADAEVARRYAELHGAYYAMVVCEYCGLITPAVVEGYRREVADLIARDGLSKETDREVRLHAWTAADLEYGNRGLGGFRNWCRTEGLAAMRRFLEYGASAAPRAGSP